LDFRSRHAAAGLRDSTTAATLAAVSIHGEAMMTRETYAKVVRAMLGKRTTRLRVIGAISVLLGLGLLALDAAGAWAEATVLIALGLMVALFLPWRVASLSARNAAPAFASPWRYELGEESLRITTPMATTEWPWRGMTALEDHADFWLLRTAMRNHAVIVLKGAFAEADRTAVAQRLGGWLGHAHS
jgi:hypothetical protein